MFGGGRVQSFFRLPRIAEFSETNYRANPSKSWSTEIFNRFKQVTNREQETGNTGRNRDRKESKRLLEESRKISEKEKQETIKRFCEEYRNFRASRTREEIEEEEELNEFYNSLTFNQLEYKWISLVTDGHITLSEMQKLTYPEFLDLQDALSVKQDIENFQRFQSERKAREYQKRFEESNRGR